MSLPDWIVNGRVELVTPVSVVGESFEVNNKNLWQLPQVKLLGRLLMLLACRTVPGMTDITDKTAQS